MAWLWVNKNGESPSTHKNAPASGEVVYWTLTFLVRGVMGILSGCPMKGRSGPSSNSVSTPSTATLWMVKSRQSSNSLLASSAVSMVYVAVAVTCRASKSTFASQSKWVVTASSGLLLLWWSVARFMSATS